MLSFCQEGCPLPSGPQLNHQKGTDRVDFSYYLVNVFTEVPFLGNSLAVFPDATGLDAKGLAARGYGTSEDRDLFNRVGSALSEREGVEAILLAGTDLSMLYESEEPAFPSLDCSVVHIRTILERFIRA